MTETYSHLWQIEKAFRISKTDSRIRPVHHYRKRRIEAHLCIAFAAYAIVKELERLLKKRKIDMSAQRAGELTRTMYELEYILPDSNKQKILYMDEEQQKPHNAIYKTRLGVANAKSTNALLRFDLHYPAAANPL